MEEESSNIFSKMKIKDFRKNGIYHYFDEKKTIVEMLKDWEFLTKRLPGQGQEIFNFGNENLSKKIGKLIDEYKLYTILHETPIHLTNNQKLSTLLKTSNSKTNIKSDIKKITPSKIAREFNEQIHFPSILEKKNEFAKKELSCINPIQEGIKNPPLKKLIGIKGLSITEKINNNLNPSPKIENIQKNDTIFSKIFDPEFVEKLKKGNRINTISSNQKAKNKKRKNIKYITINRQKYNLPENMTNNKISPSFYNIIENGNYFKYIEKIYDTTNDLNFINSMNPYLKQVYNF